MEPARPIPSRDVTNELGSGTAVPDTKTPAVVPKENVAEVMVESALIPGALIRKVAV
jgi:hypothetical protein